jgi:GH24 family phage-related lysozyme (muramidase)
VPEVGAPFEGVCSFMYLDVKGLVTTGIGNLIDTPDEALSLPWKNPDGTPATRMQIAAEWSYVKSRQDMKLHGGMAYAKVTRLRLHAAGIDLAVSRTLDRMDRQLAARFPEYESWPADAQLATLSLAWACGAAFRFPKLEACLRAGDFEGASKECAINSVGNPGVIPRNKKNRELYLSAAEDEATQPERPAASGVLGDAAVDEVERG